MVVGTWLKYIYVLPLLRSPSPSTETDEAFAGLMSICLATKDKVLLRYMPARDNKIAKRYTH